MYPDANGRLQYAADARGNRIMDFSHAGYKGGGVRIPDVRVARTVRPAAGDNTTHIQAAIDEVSQRAARRGWLSRRRRARTGHVRRRGLFEFQRAASCCAAAVRAWTER